MDTRCIATIGVAMLSGMLAPSAYGSCYVRHVGPNAVVDCLAVGREQALVVPARVRSVHVEAIGAAGGPGSMGDLSANFGGHGAFVSGDVRVIGGSPLYVLVGGIGRAAATPAAAGGFNGGGRGGAPPPGTSWSGGGGGGASDVRTCSSVARDCDTLASRLIVAGGGGGGGGAGTSPLSEGGSGGGGGSAAPDGSGTAGERGVFLGPGPGAGGAGAGASATSGGSGAPGAAAGVRGGGGAGADAGGGGGGGAFGGGGGAMGSDAFGGGGGGGSSFGPSGTHFARASSAQAIVRITYPFTAQDSPPPFVVITNPRARTSLRRHTARGGRRRLVVRGRATDASGVVAVALRIELLPRTTGGCSWLDPTAGMRRGSCEEPPSLTAMLRSDGTWVYRVGRRIALPRGRYRVTAYGTDETGIYGNSAPASRRRVTFRLTQR